MTDTDKTPRVTLLMRAEALAARGALALLRRLGPVRASNVGGAVCRIIGPRLPVSRVADANLRLAMPELDQAARRAVIRDVWDNLGRTVGEFPHLAALPRDPASGPGWDVVGAEHLAAQAARGGPVVFMSGHIGNWEMLPPGVAHHGLPFASFYRAAGNPLVDAMIRGLRDAAMGQSVPMFAKGARGARGALAHIARGGRLGMLVDQKMNDGIEARLFGHPAMTAPALAAMALRYRCPVIPGYVERLGPARLRIHVEPPMDLPDSGDRQADILALTQAVNDRLESWIRARPGSWLWLHRRWPKHLRP
ncbi:lysophospholipid acyltransferase family protein [Gluconacetobacter diazotrophicus]|uniref:Putative lipid A biosynthesis lauroyl acyltransferase n=1 Tax=Gluconacetobacter diazotrophicus (strain ATCC 49037 / DSM 5601 / CCUG 37298 / CIP 103539 / LMG 7603 / PAl5) TaxID=272568 RepID=A9H0Y3_GLUDA|nr:lauroyl acyltransferase [Gluconacetobacter diazotrophicus]CAP57187.1 putative lipid A biosynthesis lauroyl acyltransferase [Gluconacetobacter diazotrophicus PA1 5]